VTLILKDTPKVLKGQRVVVDHDDPAHSFNFAIFSIRFHQPLSRNFAD
jgi:hypothetical protein